MANNNSSNLMGSILSYYKHKPPKLNEIDDNKETNKEEKKERRDRQVTFNTYITENIHNDIDLIELITLFVNGTMSKWYYFMININALKSEVSDLVTENIHTIIANLCDSYDLEQKITGEYDISYESVLDSLSKFITSYISSINTLSSDLSANHELFKITLYNKNMYNAMCALGLKEHKFCFNNLCNQPSDFVNEKQYISYYTFGYNILTETLSEPIEYQNIISYDFKVSVQDKLMYIETKCLFELNKTVQKSYERGNRFVFFDLDFHYSGQESGHRCIVVFDCLYMNVFIMDPNGTCNYLSKFMSNDETYSNVSLPYFNGMMKQYINRYNILNGTNFKYIYDEINQCSINVTTLSSYSYDYGHCGPLSMMMSYLLYSNQDKLSEYPLQDLNKIFNKIGNEVLSNLKYNFTGNLYEIMIKCGVKKPYSINSV